MIRLLQIPFAALLVLLLAATVSAQLAPSASPTIEVEVDADPDSSEADSSATTADSASDADAASEDGSEDQPPPKQLRSPRATTRTFLEAMHDAQRDDDAWQAALDALDLSEVNEERSREVAQSLWQVLNKIEVIDWSTTPLPDESSVGNARRYQFFPAPRFSDIVARTGAREVIELVKQDNGAWQFSAQTMAEIDALEKRLQDEQVKKGLVDVAETSTSRWLRNKMPRSMRGIDNSLLGVEYWQWIGLLIIIGLGLFADLVVRGVMHVASKRVIARQDASASDKSVSKAMRPLGLVAAGITWLLLMHLLMLPDDAYTVVAAAVQVFTVLSATWAGFRVTDLVSEVMLSKAESTQTKFDDVLVPLVSKTLKVFIFAVGLIYAAHSVDINIIPMLTGLGIGGLAFAFAAKDTIENFFGSIAVVLDRPFEVGDWVVIDNTEGTVEQVGFRSTRVRTFYNSQVTVPNATLVRAVVDNYGRRQYRRWKTHIGVQYDTPPDKLIAFTEGIRELVRTHPYTRKDYFQVYLHEFADSSLNILIYVFHEVPDWSTELRERERLFLDIVRLADQLGVNFAFPTQTIHLFKEEHGPHEVQHAIPEPSTDSDAKNQGIDIVRRLVADQPWQQEKPGPVQFKFEPSEPEDEDDQIGQRTAGS